MKVKLGNNMKILSTRYVKVEKAYTVRELMSGKHNIVLRAVLREYRWSLFGTMGGYKIVVNGYRELKYVEITQTGERIKAGVIARRLQVLLLAVNIQY